LESQKTSRLPAMPADAALQQLAVNKSRPTTHNFHCLNGATREAMHGQHVLLASALLLGPTGGTTQCMMHLPW
jgi:hypothetical protein